MSVRRVPRKLTDGPHCDLHAIMPSIITSSTQHRTSSASCVMALLQTTQHKPTQILPSSTNN